MPWPVNVTVQTTRAANTEPPANGNAYSHVWRDDLTPFGTGKRTKMRARTSKCSAGGMSLSPSLVVSSFLWDYLCIAEGRQTSRRAAKPVGTGCAR
jgi:hypothetical protein